MKRIFLYGACLILLSGCFETDFNFKTTVKPNGSVIRETKMVGRGANRFVVPSGKGWQVKTYQTKSGQSLLQDTVYNVYAVGRFDSAQDITNDYQFDVEKQFGEINDEERRNFIELGITEPFSENIYSKNFIQIVKHRGLFKSIFEYQEIFQNKGAIELLLNDIKKEVVREKAVPVPSDLADFQTDVKMVSVEEGQDRVKEELKTKEEPKAKEDAAEKEESKPKEALVQVVPAVTVEGNLLAPHVLERVARERMVKDVLKKFNYRSEVSLPGKLISSNAESKLNNTAVWEFSLSDFEFNHSRYILRARSEMVEWKTVMLIVVILLAGLLGLSFVKVRPAQKRSHGTRKNHGERGNRGNR